MKKKAVAFLSSIFLIPLISAQFTLSEVASFIDPQTVFLLIMFGILGLLFKKSLDTFSALRGTTAGIISVLVSVGATFGIYKWININDLFLNLGIPSDFLSYLPIALLIVFVISLFIFKWKALIILGLLLILMALFTDLVTEKTIVLIIGIVLVAISLIWRWRRKRKTLPKTPQEQMVYQQRQRSLYDLKQKYMVYLFAYNRRGLTKHYRKRILQAMNIIIDYAKKVGVSKNEFLSSKIGGSNAKAPGDLRPPFDG